MVAKYRLLADNPTVLGMGFAGDFVYDYAGCDYGLAADDTRQIGVYHVSVTFDPTGGRPFFTVPQYLLERIED